MNTQGLVQDRSRLPRGHARLGGAGLPGIASPGESADAPGNAAGHGPWACTLEEVAEQLGVSREQARLIEQRALRKCRAFCERRSLALEDLLGI